MLCISLLYKNPGDKPTKSRLEEPPFFADLNLDQFITSITAAKDEYNLKPFFYHTPIDKDTIYYRHRIMQDMENNNLFKSVKSFAEKMQKVRRYMAMVETLEYRYNKEGWFLEAVDIYCNTLIPFSKSINRQNLLSEGMLKFREYLNNYINSIYFKEQLFGKMQILKNKLRNIIYCILINGEKVTVRKYEGEVEYKQEIEDVFKKFREKSTKDYWVNILPRVGMNHVEAQIVECVAKLYPEVFSELDEYFASNKKFIDKGVELFDREVQFYISYLEYIKPLKKKGLKLCYPTISDKKSNIYACETFDLVLAHRHTLEGSTVVCNDFYLCNSERIIVVTGPNQGGKTTFARTLGQLHYLASIGCPVPGTKANLFIPDHIFTHFQKEEKVQEMNSGLEDDLLRVKQILENITPDSLVIINEIFSSTTAKDALSLSKKVIHKIIETGSLAVWVTFLEELSSMSKNIVSMVATVDPNNPSIKTYKIIRKAADGLAYAISIAEKYRLTYSHLKERLKSESISNIQRQGL